MRNDIIYRCNDTDRGVCVCGWPYLSGANGMNITRSEFFLLLSQGLPGYDISGVGRKASITRNIEGATNDYDLRFEFDVTTEMLNEETLENFIGSIDKLQQRWEDHIVKEYGEDELVEEYYG